MRDAYRAVAAGTGFSAVGWGRGLRWPRRGRRRWGLGVDREAAEAGVAAFGDQHRQLDALLGEVGEAGVA